MIDMTKVRVALEDALAILDEVDGIDVDDSGSIGGDDTKTQREYKARISRSLLLLADRLEMASQFARSEYWYVKGEPDILNPERDD